jgi:glucose/arabinose dehydrogenase
MMFTFTRRQSFFFAALACTALTACGNATAQKAPVKTAANETVDVAAVADVKDMTGSVKIETWIDDMDQPWGLVFTAEDTALITQKSGELFLYKNGALTSISNVPEVNVARQGGLLDVALDPNWPNENWIYLSLSDPKTSGSSEAMTKIIRAKLEGTKLTNIETLFQAKAGDYVDTGFHYGSRITFDAAGHLYFSIGDRGIMADAQDISKPNGKIHRINRDGSIPADNPFVDTADAYATIYSYGNRNPQGLIVHPDTDVLWSTEHGPKGGDELNVIRSGINYGWPEISYGINYNGSILTEFTQKPGMAQPISQWTPSIAVSGLEVYQGDLFPAWNGRLMVGALAFEELRLVTVDGDKYVSEFMILQQEGRVRDVTTGPDGAIYVATSDQILRLSPADK